MIKHPYWTLYSADENGSVYGQQGQLLKPILHHTGYSVYTIRQHGKQKQVRAHRFIWECLNGIIPKDRVINHIDGNKLNNRTSNLELVTNQENAVHAFNAGLREGKPGESNSQAKLTQAGFLEIVKLLPTLTNSEIGKMYNLHPNYVWAIRHKKRWRAAWSELEKSF